MDRDTDSDTQVYLPCVLVAKKRYVGFKYENFEDVEPEFDCKGLEVIRRDGTPSLQKLQEMTIKYACHRSGTTSTHGELPGCCFALKTFRRSKSISTGTFSAWRKAEYRHKISSSPKKSSWAHTGARRASASELQVSDTTHLGSTKVAPPPGPIVAKVRMDRDPRLEPAYAERVPYIITRAEKGARVRDRAVPPEHLLANRFATISSSSWWALTTCAQGTCASTSNITYRTASCPL